MTEKPISLSKFRKAKARAEAKTKADANSVKFGRSKAERRKETADVTNLSHVLDMHKRDKPTK